MGGVTDVMTWNAKMHQNRMPGIMSAFWNLRSKFTLFSITGPAATATTTPVAAPGAPGKT